MDARVIERTLYPPIVEHLRSIGFDSIGESSAAGKGFSDVVFSMNGHRFVLEIKLDKFSPSLSTKAISQAFSYARQYDTHDILVIIYPDLYKNSLIPDGKWLSNLALNQKVQCHIFTDWWTETLESTASNVFSELKSRIENKNRKIDLQSVVSQIQTIVSDLNVITNYVKKEDLATEVVEKLDLFTAIGEIKDKKVAERQVSTLSSYLLFNQLLFYRIYQKKNPDLKLDELEKIGKIRDLQGYFKKITDIDYESIYKPNILGHIDDNDLIVDTLNRAIEAINLIKAEFITHDLAGRFFHDLIPFEVRKILAAYYTHPNSADLLAGLTIGSWDDTIMDPACGSGTLLIASYATKLDSYKKAHGYENFEQLHKRFIENDITGSDLMPFASHLTTINLAMQEIDQKTNVVRIASMDSLNLASTLKSSAFLKGKGLEIKGFERTAQMTLEGQTAWEKKEGAVSAGGRGAKFYLKPLDVVIMNPPFSDREKMPKEMRDRLNHNETLNNLVGGQVNLWGSFIGLAHLLLKDDGRMGAVIPTNVARGKATQKVRDLLLKNYTCRFMIIPLKDTAFSEGANFSDILFIADKKKPENKDYTAIVSIKLSIKEMSAEDARRLMREMRDCYESRIEKNTDGFEITFMNAADLLKYSDNMMPLIGFRGKGNQQVISGFLDSVKQKAKGKLVKIDSNIIREGFHASPEGLSELVFITKALDDSRIKRAFLIAEEGTAVQIKNTDMTFNIPVSKTHPALRTLTAVKTFHAKDIDRIITTEPEGFKTIKQLSKWKGEFDWFKHSKNVKHKSSYLVVGRRFRPNSPNTHHFAFYSEDKIVAPHTFKILDFDSSDDALLQTMILNSSITMASILMLREQTTGGFTDIMETELVDFDIFNLRKLTEGDKKRLRLLFKYLGKFDFPSITEQYVTSSELLKRLDTTILEILGFGEHEISSTLDKLYKVIADELIRKADQE